MESVTEEEIRKAIEAALELQKETPEGFTTAEYVKAIGLDPDRSYHRVKAISDLKKLVEEGTIVSVRGLLRYTIHGRPHRPDGWKVAE